MPQTLTNFISEQSPDGVKLLISMLVRYPQIGTINFDSETNSLKFTFIISNLLSQEEYIFIQKLLTSSIDSYHSLLQISKKTAGVDIYAYEGVSMLTVTRDVTTLSCGEITLLVNILREQFDSALASDMDDETVNNEDVLINDEIIETILKNVRKQSDTNKSLIGVREDGRVFVFNK